MSPTDIMDVMSRVQSCCGENDLPAVSVIMPVLNEERHLADSVQGVLDQGWQGPLEIVLCVGPCHDRTLEVAHQLAKTDQRLVIIENPSGTTPDALNLAITASSHDIVIRVDAHGVMTPGYIATAVRLLRETGAANVGGLMDAQGETPFEQAVAVAYNSRLGLGGGSFHLASSPEGPAPTVFLGSFRREALLRVGGYDPSLLRAQDWDLNHRLRASGELVWFTPDMRVLYRPRSSISALAKQFFRTGQWRREVIRRDPSTASLRYLAPPTATLGVGAGALAGLVGVMAGLAGRSRLAMLVWALVLPLGYLGAITAGSAVLRQQLALAVRLRMPLVLSIIHLSWGAGFLKGLNKDERVRPEHAPRPGLG